MTTSKEKANSLLEKMTIDEKVAQLSSFWMYEISTSGELDNRKIGLKLNNGIGQISRVGGASTKPPMEIAKASNQIQKFLIEETRLGVPAILHEESCSGAMVLGGTMYPQMIGLASTFDPTLAERMTTEIRKQLIAIGARQSLSPVLDVCRDPRWGRTEETFGEDPTLISNFGVSFVRGLQWKSKDKRVLATGKHFIGHSFSLGGLNCAPSQVGVHEIYDVLSAPFHAAIRDAGLETIMNAYPELDGEVVAASRHILTGLLREVFGFKGLIVSDYNAIFMIKTHHYMTDDLTEAARLALEAGIEIEFPSTQCFGDPLKQALKSGKVKIDLINSAVMHHLEKKFDLGLFDDPFVSEGNVLEVFETEAQRALGEEIAIKSMVLLKNDDLLPLKKNLKKLAIIGPNADEGRNQLGDYSYHATRELWEEQNPEGSNFAQLSDEDFAKHSIRIVSVLEGIKNLVSSETEILYAKGCEIQGRDQKGFTDALKAAKEAEVIILVLGDKSGLIPNCTSGEFRDSADLKLQGQQEALAKAIFDLGKPVIVVLINGRPYAIPWIDEKANAILEAWLPGEEGGNAVAKVLFGYANPGGKLPISFPRQAGQLPVFYNHKKSGMKSHIYGDYVSEKTTPLYPFGYGLSYTTFEYSALKMNKKKADADENVRISFHVRNSGSKAGDEIVQLYIEDEYASSPRPVKELKGYNRVSLAPGDEKVVIFNLNINQLAFFNPSLELVVESGKVKIMIGSSSEEIYLTDTLIVSKGRKLEIKDRVFECPVQIEKKTK